MKHFLKHFLPATIFEVLVYFTLGQFRLDNALKRRCIVVMLLCAALMIHANAQWAQQGPKLVGAGAVGTLGVHQGWSASISSDGNTAIVGGISDNSNVGAAWIFTRSAGVWAQQGPKLVGTGAVGSARQGSSVSISSDGNTAIVGGPYDNGTSGAVWVFTRSAGVWTQQGPKLIGAGAVGNAAQGWSISISSDGNTAFVGGPYDNGNIGAVWVFTRSAGVWTQQGPKLIGAGAVGNATQGWSISISSDGNTAVLGGYQDDSNRGAAWIFIRSNGVWAQQGPKLVGTGAVGSFTQQGYSISISSNGNTAIVGGLADDNHVGATWIFTRSNDVWTQQGPKLVGTGAVGQSNQGKSVSISSDGNTAIVGGYGDNFFVGAAWIFTRSAGVWTQQGPKLIGEGAVGNAWQGYSISISSDGNTAIVGGVEDNSSAGAAWVFAKLLITRPQAGERWIAGEQDTIRWTGGAAGNFLEIELSVDSGITYTRIDFAIPADSGYYLWTVPDSLSTRARIRLSDAFTSDSLAVSDTFKVKGYVLTRYDAIGHYEPFTFGQDRWSFGNVLAPGGVWDSLYSSQFNYQTGFDPYMNYFYPQDRYLPFRSASSLDFPPWPVFVRAFGVDACYYLPGTLLMYYRPSAILKWWAIKDDWIGSCSGFSISSILAFDNPSSFGTAFPELPSFGNLFNVSLNDSARKVIHSLAQHWNGEQHQQFFSAIRTKTPNETIRDLKTTLGRDLADHSYLYIANNNVGGGAHAIVPYSLLHDPANPRRYFINVYDNSYFNTTTARIIVDTTGNSGNGTWTYSLFPTWGGNSRLILMDSSSTYLTPPILPRGLASGSTFPTQSHGTQTIMLYPTLHASIRITDNAGHAIGFVDSMVIDSIPGAVPLTPPTGSETPPYSYLLPAGEYSILLNDLTDSVVSVGIFSDSSITHYYRNDASGNQFDRLRYSGGFSTRNSNPVAKRIDIRNVVLEQDAEKLFVISNYLLSQNDSLHVRVESHDDLKVTNVGGQKTYDLDLLRAGTSSVERFASPGISLAANSAHLILPTWTDLAQPVTIYVDLGNNGTIDDTLIVNNTVDVDEQGNNEVPREYSLAQNYPNPFNPSTRIEYALPHPGHVRLTVYNVLGQLVATLVDGDRPAGRFAAEWNGTNVSSGVYFYRVEARQNGGQVQFTSVRKMLLMK